MGPTDKVVAKDENKISAASSLAQGLPFIFLFYKALDSILVLCIIWSVLELLSYVVVMWK